MRHRSKAMLQTVQDLLSTGMHGELKGGETLGLWTFNEDLYTGRFPLQVWAPEERKAIVQRTLGFLKAQGCEKQPRLEQVIPALENVVKDSELITVILITAGDAKMRGTPFDDLINDDYARWHNEQQNGQVPLVTVLRARNGKMIRCSVRPASGPVEFPPLPPPEAPVVRTEPPAPVPAPAPQEVPPPMAPPLILSGKKFRPETTQPPETEAPAVKVEPPLPGPGPAESAASASQGSVSSPASGSSPAFPSFGTANPPETAACAPEAAHPASAPAPALKPLASSLAPSEPSTTAPTPSGRPARIVQPASVSHARPMRLWAGSILAGSGCLAFGLFRLRAARQAPRLSLITCSLDGGSNKPPSPVLLGQAKGTDLRGQTS
jgi:hypothetical protein